MDIPDILAPHAERSPTSPNLFKSGAPVPASTRDWRHSAAGPLDDDDDEDEGDSWSKGGDDDDDEDEDDDLDDGDEDSADSVRAC